MPVRNTDPLVGFYFRLEVSGKIDGYFLEVSGIGSETAVTDHNVSVGGIEIVQKLPGRLKWGDITLKRGITAVMDMWAWRATVEAGDMVSARANGSIYMLDTEMKPIARWDFVNAWPSKVTGPSVKSDDNSYGVEELVLVHEGIKRMN